MAIVTSANLLSSERQISSDNQAQVDAFAVAQSGLEQYFSTIIGMPPASVDTTITTLPGGTAVSRSGRSATRRQPFRRPSC